MANYTVFQACSWTGMYQDAVTSVSFAAGAVASPTTLQQWVLDNFLVPEGKASNPAGQTGVTPGITPYVPPVAGALLTADGQGGASWQSGAVPVLGGTTPIAGPPSAAGTTVGQSQMDANGLVWVWNGSQWQLGGAGIELGYAETSANYTLTTTFAVPPGLAVPVTVPGGVDIAVEAGFPWVLNGATGSNSTSLWLALYEDAVLIKSSITQFATANVSSSGYVAASYQPSSAGSHTYSVQVKQGAASVGATVEAGLQSGLLVNPFLRVRTV